MNNIKILLAEDDSNLGLLLKNYLNAKNYDATLVKTGAEALEAFSNSNFHICIFDIILSELDGITLAREVKSMNHEIPIIFLSAKNRQEDIIEGFVAGADDYVTKPFSMEELLFRIEAILRRTGVSQAIVKEVYKLGNFTFDSLKQILGYKGEDIKLTTKESDLLDLLYRHRNTILERNYALRTIWIDDNYFNARSMDVYISKLRRYLNQDPSLKILNVHGKGYKLIC